MRFTTLAVLSSATALVLLAACAGGPSAPVPASGVELANMDRSVRPQDDFFLHVNGTWLKNTEIPADKARYGAFDKLRDDSEARLRAIIEESSTKQGKQPGSDEQKVGDLYNSFMDEARVDALGLKPIEAELARVDAMKSKGEIPALMAHLLRTNATTPINGFVNQDAKKPTEYIVYLFQSGLGLPDRDYYLLDDAKFKGMRAGYVAHVEKVLGLAGDKDAAKSAKAIMALETALAKKYWTRVDSRDDDKTYNKHELAKVNAVTPGFDLAAYLRAAGVTTDAVIVMQPSALTGFADELKAQSLATWKTYFRWHLIRSYSPYLSKPYVDENFAFYGKTMRGIQENRPRWKRAVEAVENSLGESLGKIYVARHFPPEHKARMDVLVANLVKAYDQSIRSLEWMSEETKQQALVKLGKFTPKIGYPDKWRDYSGLTIDGGDLVGNLIRSARFEHEYQIAKLGKPIDRAEWFMTPQTVNAYYNPGMNEIVFPAAILQPPFFNAAADDAVNYGGIGAVIAHEIGHGFDDQGSKYDGNGQLRSWWTDEDRSRFEARTGSLIAQYSAYEPIPGYKVNGALGIGENIGDLGGASIALRAYRIALAGREAPVIDGYTGDQRFFIGFGQIWRGAYREQRLLEQIKVGPHSPPHYRCNGPLVNVPEFYTAFDVKEGDKMFKPAADRVKIW
ncbi:MAG: M13 family metallopeptidase [Gammaproteobacteria bacterium]